MKIFLIFLTLILSSCMSAGNLKKHANFNHSGEAKGIYSKIAACVLDSFENSENANLNTLAYEVRSFPEIKRTEILARGDHNWGAFYGLTIKFLQSDIDTTKYDIVSFFEFEGKESIKFINNCSEK